MSKNLNIRAKEATREIFDILGVKPSGDQSEKVAKAIEQVIIKALRKSTERSTGAATGILSTDKDMAHKITDKIRLANKALITNLSAMR